MPTVLLLLLLSQAPEDPYPELPPLSHAVLFPSREHAQQQEGRCRAWEKWYAMQEAYFPNHIPQLQATQWTLRLQARQWEYLARVQSLDSSRRIRRVAMDDLKTMMGADAFLMGRMPDDLPPLPGSEEWE